MKAVCLRPECGRQTVARGLCRACHSAANNLVRNGKLTWEQLEKEGKAAKLVYKVRNRSASNWLLGIKKPSGPTDAELLAKRAFDAWAAGYKQSGGSATVLSWEDYTSDKHGLAGWVAVGAEAKKIAAESKEADQ